MEKVHVLHGVCLIWEKWIKRQGPNLLLSSAQVPGRRKLEKLFWERFVQKEYNLSPTSGWENYKQKYVTEVQRENSRKFNYYAEWISDDFF